MIFAGRWDSLLDAIRRLFRSWLAVEMIEQRNCRVERNDHIGKDVSSYDLSWRIARMYLRHTTVNQNGGEASLLAFGCVPYVVAAPSSGSRLVLFRPAAFLASS